MTTSKPKETLGGVRPGAGRKPDNNEGSKVTITFRLAPDVVAIIRQQENKAEFLERLVRLSISS